MLYHISFSLIWKQILKGTFSGLLIIISILLLSCSASSSDAQAITNSKASSEKPYLILISLDGFRWDYVDRFQPPNLMAFIQNGVKAESLIPSFPSKTFPNHYTIATGLYPDKHGLIGNTFYNYEKEVTYTTGNRQLVQDGSFYGGSPIWVQAKKANMVSASYFFVGTEADIQGSYPDYYHNYDGSIKNDQRIDEAIKWLAMPEENRPHLITMYFSDMDDVGHKYGPTNDKEIKTVLFELDRSLGDLFSRTAATKLPINIIIVSDHGMANVPTPNMIPIENLDNNNLYSIINNGAILNVHPKDGVKTDSVYQYLKMKENNFKVYRTENTPQFETKPVNKDWGSIQIIPNFGYYFNSRKSIEQLKKYSIELTGVHGYDPEYKDMHGIFYANGPAFKIGYTVPSVKNIHIYPLMCEILGLGIPDDIDGRLDQLEDVLKK
uniref:alkaline phosphatase family protein n=1 Tax=Fulvivirga sp. TaxID=1931237 RepID=UPI0040494717